MTVSRGWRRGSLTRFVATHEFRWDLAMGILTVVYVALAFQEDAPVGFVYAVWGLACIFLIEFATRCYDSPDRSAYLRSHWLDLITAVPVPGIPGLRILRLLRLLRLGKVGYLVRKWMLRHGWHETGLIWPTLFLFWIGSALALFFTEHDAPGSSITTFPDAMTAAFLTAATLGFGRHTAPITQDGQIVAAIIVFFALGLWGFASGRLAAMWLHVRQGDANAELGFVREELRAIRDELTLLAKAIMPVPDEVESDSERPAAVSARDGAERAAVPTAALSEVEA